MVEANAPSMTGPIAPVVVVSHGFQTNYERGFCNGLAVRGWPVTLVSSDRTDHGGLEGRIEDVNLRGSQDEARPWWEKLRNIVRYHARLLGLVFRRRGRTAVHVIGLTEPPLLCGVLEGIWFRMLSRSYALTIHDILPHDNHTAWMKWCHALAYRIPHRLVVHTPRMAEELATRFGIDRGKVVVMEHGIEPDPPLLDTRAKSREAGPLRLLFFGNVMRYKGLDVLIDAVSSLQGDFELVVSGLCIDRRLAEDLRTQIATHPQRASIRWDNAFVPEQRMRELFGWADALVLPYRHIDQSGVLFQALRLGVPVVATRSGSMADYVSPEVGELCEPGSAPDLAAAINRLAGRLSQLSRVHIQELGRRFEWPITVACLADVYGSTPRPGTMA